MGRRAFIEREMETKPCVHATHVVSSSSDFLSVPFSIRHVTGR